ncbi:c-type cytochrome [Parendozoicomonas sp. Alg238-R29]|uniref:c-type cytochrome n=1 Tax=Parendozoicomonas sp. Alg238-R29 TaxID=2993446 RepID=UPI00248F18C1|nr:c-type cytochrome [Parendozoicomonas sp. Alg238-R29]
MKIITRTTFFLAALLAAQTGMAQKAPEQIYQTSCRVCHDAGIANAPRKGNAENWEPRLKKGMDTLVQSVIKGVGAMPPRGMCMDCSPEDYQAVISYMSSSQ